MLCDELVVFDGVYRCIHNIYARAIRESPLRKRFVGCPIINEKMKL